MNYEQKYKEALETVQEILSSGADAIRIKTLKLRLQSVFPELAESKDERIRKELIEHIKANYEADYVLFKKFPPDDVIAWLEKQGEQPTDKIEPKFKVGDWIVQAKIGVYKVIEICESWYEVVDNKDKHYSIGFDKEYMCHLWTINDAKDGDVLVSEDKSKIFLYNGKLDLRGRTCAYCGIYKTYDGLRFTKVAIGNYFTYKKFYPATKEQRDLLFSKMKQAGYEWDSEKKELTKIVDKSSWSEEDERNLKGIIDEIEANKNSAPDCDLATHDMFLSCLKSIRQRIGV